MREPKITVRQTPVPWAIGEHVAIIGTTGTGKTYLTSRLLELRQYVVVLRTKPDDIKYRGFKRYSDTRMLATPNRAPKQLIVPEYRKQRSVAASLFDTVWDMGSWTIVVDELFYVHEMLGLKEWVEMLLTQGRSKRISVVVGMQRPVHVTRFALSEASHIFSFRLEGRDQRTVRDIASESFAVATGKVQPFHFAHWYVKGRSVGIGTADKLDRVLLPPGGSGTMTSEDRASRDTGHAR